MEPEQMIGNLGWVFKMYKIRIKNLNNDLINDVAHKDLFFKIKEFLSNSLNVHIDKKIYVFEVLNFDKKIDVDYFKIMFSDKVKIEEL